MESSLLTVADVVKDGTGSNMKYFHSPIPDWRSLSLGDIFLRLFCVLVVVLLLKTFSKIEIEMCRK